MEAQKILDIIKEKEKEYSFSDYIENYISIDELKKISNTDDLRDYLNKINEDSQITDTEIIYYASAMDYLKENDISLNESLQLAHDYGFTLEKLNSETLASILASENNRIDYDNFVNDVIGELE